MRAAGVTDYFGCSCSASFYFLRPPPSPRARFPSKSGGWRREKKQPVLKGAARTDLSAAEEDPRSGRALQPAGALERRARAERWLRSTRCPPSRGCAAPSLGVALPAPTPGTREPPSSIFCAVSAKLRGSWSFCSTIYRLRQHCEKKAERWPLPRPSAGSLERKAPAHDLSTQRASRPPPASCSPLPPPPPHPQLGPGRCQPRHVPSRENQLPRAVRLPPGSVAAASAQLRSQLVAGVASPGGAHGLGTGTLATRPGILARTPRAEWPRAYCALLRLYPLRSLGAPPPCLQSARAFGPRLGAHGLDKSLCPLVRLHQQALGARPRCPHWWPTGVRGAGVAGHRSQAKARGAGSAGRTFALRRCS